MILVADWSKLHTRSYVRYSLPVQWPAGSARYLTRSSRLRASVPRRWRAARRSLHAMCSARASRACRTSCTCWAPRTSCRRTCRARCARCTSCSERRPTAVSSTWQNWPLITWWSSRPARQVVSSASCSCANGARNPRFSAALGSSCFRLYSTWRAGALQQCSPLKAFRMCNTGGEANGSSTRTLQ